MLERMNDLKYRPEPLPFERLPEAEMAARSSKKYDDPHGPSILQPPNAQGLDFLQEGKPTRGGARRSCTRRPDAGDVPALPHVSERETRGATGGGIPCGTTAERVEIESTVSITPGASSWR